MLTRAISDPFRNLKGIQILLGHSADLIRQGFYLGVDPHNDRTLDFLLKSGANVKALGEQNESLLWAAAEGRGVDVSPASRLRQIKRLLGLGVEPKSRAGFLQRLCIIPWLDEVVAEETIQTINLLVEKGAVVNDEDEELETALQVARSAVSTTTTLVELLLEQGADVNAQGDGGCRGGPIAA